MKKFLAKLLFRQPGEGGVKDALLFLALFAFFALVFNALFSATPLLPQVAAFSSLPFVNLLGLDAVVEQKEFPHLVAASGGVATSEGGAAFGGGAAFDAEITYLCGGGVELAVLLALVAATRDRSIRARLGGMALGVAALLLFNPVRIALSLAAFGTPVFALAHDVLFRASIVVIVVGVYAVWYLKLSKAGSALKAKD